MCVPIFRSIGTQLTKLENMQISRFIWFIWRHVTQNGTSYVMGTTTLLIGILTRNILKSTRSLYEFRFKSYGSNSGFRVFSDLDLDLWPMFYCFVTRIANPSSMNGWYAAVKVLKNALCFIMGYLVAMEIRVTLFLLVQFFMCYIV